MQKLNFWVPLQEPKWHNSVCPSIHLPPPEIQDPLNHVNKNESWTCCNKFVKVTTLKNGAMHISSAQSAQSQPQDETKPRPR